MKQHEGIHLEHDAAPNSHLKVEKVVLFVHSLVKCASQPKYFTIGNTVVNEEMSRSEMIADILSWSASQNFIFFKKRLM